jgi:polyvinyl alcohol dehydrogenase (cytochrome)
LIWKVHPIKQLGATVTATARFYKGVVYQPFASIEEVLAGDPRYDCCTYRGSVVALDAATGKTIWQSFTIPEAAKPPQHGPSGASIWSSPTIDERLGALYVATGDRYERRHPRHGPQNGALVMVEATDRQRRL